MSNTPALSPQAYRMILAAADNLIHLARLHGVLPTLETEPRLPLAMGNHFLRLTMRPVRHPDPAAADNCRAPHVLEKLSYHEGARQDMSLEECLSYLANGWKETPGRSHTQLVLQLTELLAAAPAQPYCYSDCRAYTHGIEAELQALRKQLSTYQAREALGLKPNQEGDLGPDGKEWAKTAAGYAHVDAMLPRADGQGIGPYWYGWALRGAFVAGAEWQEARTRPAPDTTYAPLTITEARDLTCMLAGAPWPDEMLPELQRLLAIYDGLRLRNQRPVDPATLPREVAKVVMETGSLPDTAQPETADHHSARYGDFAGDLAKEGPLVVTLESVNEGTQWHATSNHSERIVVGQTSAQNALRLALINAGQQPAPAAQGDALTQAARDVLAERQRQISAEGWTPEHDDEHAPGELAIAGACYAAFSKSHPRPGHCPSAWPWSADQWKPSPDPRRNLVKATALLLAELERMYRAAAPAPAALTQKEGDGDRS